MSRVATDCPSNLLFPVIKNMWKKNDLFIFIWIVLHKNNKTRQETIIMVSIVLNNNIFV